MYKKIIALFLLVCAIYTYSFAYTNINNFKPKYGYVIKNANIRTNPTTGNISKVHKVLSKNTNVKIVGEINSFYIVQTNENLVGAVSKSLIKIDQNRKPKNASTYTNLREKSLYTSKKGLINIRSGPSTSFKIVSKMNEKDKVKVIGKINNFYLIVTAKNNIGMVREDLLTKVSNNNSNTNNNTTSSPSKSDVVLITGTSTEQEVLNLINDARAKKGLPKLKLAKRLTEIARLKSNDMTKFNYFSHDSKTYGSPFKMLQDFGISYKQAGENIAGNPSIKDGVNSWISSSSHAKNIYSNSYNYVGIGISKSNTYGYIITAIFIGK